jgi:hypothetical protein
MLTAKPRARPAAGLPSVVKLVVRGWVIGAVLGAAFAGLLILTNAVGLHDLIRQSPDAVTAVALLVFGFATLFAGLYSATAVMLVPAGGE